MKAIAFLLGVVCAFAVANGDQHAAPKGLDPDKALKELKQGNKRYLTGNIRHDGQGEADRFRLKSGQTPHTIILSCADSRVPPEVLFDQKLGEVFVVRVAGQALDTSVLASMEYAIEHLGARNVIVMGHTSCGAVKAALSTKPGESAGSKSLDALVSDIRPRVVPDRAIASEMSPNVEIESAHNAEMISKELGSRSPIIQKAIDSKKIKVSWGLYHIDTGVVDFH